MFLCCVCWVFAFIVRVLVELLFSALIIVFVVGIFRGVCFAFAECLYVDMVVW